MIAACTKPMYRRRVPKSCCAEPVEGLVSAAVPPPASDPCGHSEGGPASSLTGASDLSRLMLASVLPVSGLTRGETGCSDCSGKRLQPRHLLARISRPRNLRDLLPKRSPSSTAPISSFEPPLTTSAAKCLAGGMRVSRHLKSERQIVLLRRRGWSGRSTMGSKLAPSSPQTKSPNSPIGSGERISGPSRRHWTQLWVALALLLRKHSSLSSSDSTMRIDREVRQRIR